MRIVLGIRLAQYQKKRATKLDCNVDYILTCLTIELRIAYI